MSSAENSSVHEHKFLLDKNKEEIIPNPKWSVKIQIITVIPHPRNQADMDAKYLQSYHGTHHEEAG